MEISNLYEAFLRGGGVSTDTRTIQPGQVFFALKGENFNGDDYAGTALEKGASLCVVSRSCALEEGEKVVKVDDTLAALKELAAWHRNHFLVDGERITLIGLTGTNGKTTTKELIREVLSKKYSVTATKGNLNNDVGVPLSVLSICPGTEIAVIEMGANHPDDIAELVKVSQPDYGLITNVGKAHLLGFGDFEGVKRAKGRLYDYISAEGKAVFANVDDPDINAMATSRGLSIIPYGLSYSSVEVLPSDAEHPFLRLKLGKKVINTSLVGSYNAINVLAALTVGRYFGVPDRDAIMAIEAYVPSNNRSQMKRTERNSVVIDAYNANPSSMKAALDNLAFFSGDKVLALGSMGELGAESLHEHEELLKRIDSIGAKEVILVGEEFAKAVKSLGGRDYKLFPNSDEACAYLMEHPVNDCVVLVKGSRSTKMENVIPAL